MNRLALADGGILLGRHSNEDDIRRLCADRFPFVYVGRRDIADARLWYVTADYRSATRTVVDHLKGLGHESIAYLGVPRPDEPDEDRVAGWRDRKHTLRASRELRPAEVTPDLLLSLVRNENRTAVLVENAESADAVFAAASAGGLRVPGHLSIAVLGDLPDHGMQRPIWTGFTTPRRRLGREAVRMLVQRLDHDAGDTPRIQQVDCGFEQGSTCGPVEERVR